MTDEGYLRSVEWELRDLPWKQRRELVAELRAHLAELPDDAALPRLGPPEQYAAELRSAAGLERRRGPIALVRRRRPRTVVLAVLALALIGLAIGAVSWVESYQPFVAGGTLQLPPGAQEATGLNGYSIAVQPGKPFELGMSVQNTGRFTVRIVGVPLDMARLPFHGRLLMEGPVYHRGTNENRPFHPVDLKPGQAVFLVIDGAYDCGNLTEGSVVSPFLLPVRYTFLWRTTTAMLGFNVPLALNVPQGAKCPKIRR